MPRRLLSRHRSPSQSSSSKRYHYSRKHRKHRPSELCSSTLVLDRSFKVPDNRTRYWSLDHLLKDSEASRDLIKIHVPFQTVLNYRHQGCNKDYVSGPNSRFQGFTPDQDTYSILTFNGKIVSNRPGAQLSLVYKILDVSTILTSKEISNTYIDFSIPHHVANGERFASYLLQLSFPSDCQITIEAGAIFTILCLPCIEDSAILT